ncbi:MAG: hypothetical protein PVG99_04680 [Desulfobacteraceae bacterium]|jgi:DNA-binding NtrC family response regulator
MHGILIVDNDEAIRWLHAADLSEDGYEVIATGGGPMLMETIHQDGIGG